MTEPAEIRVVAPGPGEQSPATEREAWIAAGQALAQSRSQASWEFADWLAAGHAAWGKTAMEEAAEATDTSAGKIINYRKAAKTYPPTRRRVGLTFSHHLEAAFLPDTEREQLLDRAEAGNWSQRETRAAAREASLEGKLARARRENAELKRALKAARTDPRDAAAQAGARLGATRRLIREELNRTAGVIQETAESEALDGLHGNARRGLVARIVKEATGIVADVNAANARIAAAAEKIKGEPL